MFSDLLALPGLWRPTRLVEPHQLMPGTVTLGGCFICRGCRQTLDLAELGAPCFIETVGIACSDCGEPVYFPLTAVDLDIYHMKGTLCTACLHP